ncbi:MAG: hypothetical protein LH629_09665 [Ignavibacteria bacterium]|nr:hypothetical protein [Ignavibacteria bacterium]
MQIGLLFLLAYVIPALLKHVEADRTIKSKKLFFANEINFDKLKLKSCLSLFAPRRWITKGLTDANLS